MESAYKKILDLLAGSEFKRILDLLARKGSNEYQDCSSNERASVMIEALFDEAEGKVCILSDHLNPLIYGKTEVMDAALGFIQKNGSQLIIILQFNQLGADTLPQNKFLSYLVNYRDRISIYLANDLLKDFRNHFMIVKTEKGNNAMMFELDIKKHLTTGCFNVGEFGDELFDFADKAQLVLLRLETI
ncbi:MAG: hypothetical protein NUV61_00320 [Candidatus Azambacteria bacterium]|nr:hypothetical protein [Candidatus Azambacteria bacterium]